MLRIPDFNKSWEKCYKLRVLSINEKSPALEALNSWKTQQNSDYKKIIISLRYATEQKKVCNGNKIKRGKGYTEVYEARAHLGKARLFFFYYGNEIIICTNSYWKKGKKNKAQNRAFKLADKFRLKYIEERENG